MSLIACAKKCYLLALALFFNLTSSIYCNAQIRVWTEQQQKQFLDTCIAYLHKDSIQQNRDRFCKCLLFELKAKYSFDEATALSPAQIDPVVIECLPSGKTKSWHLKVRNDFKQDCIAKASYNNVTKSPEEYCECFTKKMEATYPSLKEFLELRDDIRANFQSKIAVECLPNMASGEWPADMKRKYIDKCIIEAVEQNRKNPAAYCNCTVEQLQKTYPDYKELLKIPGEEFDKIIQKCK